jgi:hypothetical protein
MIRLIVLFGFLMSPLIAMAQETPHFQGSFIIDRTLFNTETDVVEGQNTLRLDVNKNRLRLISDGDITVSRMMAGMQTSTIFLRHDKDDMLFITRPNEAVQLTKASMAQLSGMIQQFGGGRMTPRAETTEVIKTGEQEYIMGYLCEKIAIRRPQRDEVTFVWLTDSVKVNWGLFTEMPAEFSFSMTELFDRAWLDSGSFPMLAITFRGGKVSSRVEVVDMVADDPESINIDIARSVRTIALSDYIFSNMMRR